MEGHNIDNLLIEFTKIFNKKQLVFFIKYLNNISVWFAQGQLRTDYVEGKESSSVGYLEGMFVKEEYRNRGDAKEFLCACEKWQRSKDVKNLLVIVNLIIATILSTILQWNLMRQIV